MRSSWLLALSELLGRRTRATLLVVAVAMAVSLVVGVTAAIGSAQHSFESTLVRILGAADARIVHLFNGRFDASVLETVAAWPEVEAVTGRLYASVTLVHEDGKVDHETGRAYRETPEAIGVEIEQESRFRDVPMIRGRRPAARDEIIVGPLTAEKLAADVGDRLQVQRFGTPITLTVTGVYERKVLGTLQRLQIRMDRRVLGEASNRADQLTSVAIILEDGVDVQAFCDRYASQMPEALALEPAIMIRTGFDRRVKASRLSIVLGSILTFMSASFIVVTAMSTAVSERQREMAIIRCIGGRRRQLFLSQIWYGLIIGGLGALLGVALGLALGRTLVWFFRDMVPSGFHPMPIGIVSAVVGALGAGLLGAIYPALLASRVSPLRAMATMANPTRPSAIIACGIGGLLLIGLQLLMHLIDDPEQRFLKYAWIGLPALYLGYFLIAVPMLMGVTTLLVGPLATLMRLPVELLRRSVLATPIRNGLTAGALMVGLSLLVADWSSAQSLMRDWIGNVRFPDGFAVRTTGISRTQQEAIADLPGVEQTCAIGYLPVETVGQQIFGVGELAPRNVVCVGFDPDLFFKMNAVIWWQGDPEVALPRLAEGDAILVADRFLTARDIGLGDTIKLGAGGIEHEYEIVGVVSSAGLDIAIDFFGIRNVYTEFAFSCVFMDFRTVREHYRNDDALIVQLDLGEDVDDETFKTQVEEAVPGVVFRSGRWIRKTINDAAAGILAIQSTVAFCALILACIGVGNIVLASLHARRFEYGVLRAIGGTRGVLLRLIMAEVTLMAIAGAVTGTVLGLHMAWANTHHYRDLAGLLLTVKLPVVPTSIGWLVVLTLTLLAALPAALTVIRQTPAALVRGGRGG